MNYNELINRAAKAVEKEKAKKAEKDRIDFEWECQHILESVMSKRVEHNFMSNAQKKLIEDGVLVKVQHNYKTFLELSENYKQP